VTASGWTHGELDAIGGADELRIAPLDADGAPRRAVPIWVVRVGDDLYVRSYRGTDGAWYRAARKRRAGRVQAGGVSKDVTFRDAAPDVTQDIDAAYRDKYARFAGYLPPMLTDQARATTLRLVPTDR